MPGRRVPFVGVLRFEQADAPGQGDPAEEGRGKPEAVVRMEGHFRQQVRERDAQEDSGGKGQAAPQEEM